MIGDDDLAALLDEHAPMRACSLVPAVRAWHATDEIPLWQALEEITGITLSAPFFCVPWPGAQALARAVLDEVVDVRNKSVVDVGCGSGVAAVAAALSGARVTAIDVDPLAVQAARILARRHGVDIATRAGDALGVTEVDDADVILAGDLVYSATQLDAFRAAVGRWGSRAVLADSGRPFFEACGRPCIATYSVPVAKGVDGADARTVRVYGAAKLDAK